MDKYKVNEKCIACRACVGVASDNFKIEGNTAIVFKQPISDLENNLCREAMDICPTEAIEIEKKEVITAESNVRDTLEKYPILKEKLPQLSKKFKTMQNPIMYNSLAKFATFNNASKMTGVSVCEILHFVNKEIGMEDELLKVFPKCVEELKSLNVISANKEWNDSANKIFIEENDIDKVHELVNRINNLGENEIIDAEGYFEVSPIVKLVEELGFKYSLERLNLGRVKFSVFNDLKNENFNASYDILDVRYMTEDPFDIIIKKAYEVKENASFILIQSFIPDPMLNMLSGMGFDNEVEEKGFNEYWIKFTKKESLLNEDINNDKPSLTIQSATPVGYPIIMRLLQSKRLKEVINIKELKIWEETEKHLGWIVNKKADVSFSAVITASKLKESDVKMPIVFVWDNFTILTRGYTAKDFEDLKGKKIYLPLFEDAPPAKITKYLIKAKGLNIDEFNFVFGKPFGRPKEMLEKFVSGEIDTVLLREPEAGFAVQSLNEKGIVFSEISYAEVWNEINPGFGLFPNAGVILKGELVRKHPEIVEILSEEIKASIEWVNKNKDEASKLSYDMMRNSVDHVKSFLDRATFKYVSGDELVDKVKDFYSILIKNEILNTKIDEKLLDMFR